MGVISAIRIAARRHRVAAVEGAARRRSHRRRLRALRDGIDRLEEQLAARAATVQQLELTLLQVAELYTRVVDAGEAIAVGWPATVRRPDDVDKHCNGIRRTITAALSADGRLREDALLSAIHRTAGMAIDVAIADAAFIGRLRQQPEPIE